MRRRPLVGWLLALAVVSIPIAFLLGEGEGGRARGPKIAVLDLIGAISDSVDLGVNPTGSARKLIENLRAVREDPSVAAVVVRINSGGGSAATSQEIHREIQKVRAAGKPVVVSMGDRAASGGYYAAVAADEIFANPATITGSIGVLAQFWNASGLAEEHGVELITVKSGPFKDIGNPTQPFTEAEREAMQAVIDDTLEQFVRAVAEGRGLDYDETLSVADGRLFTGSQALELGLIDELGGVEEAIDRAKALAGVEGDVEIVRFVERAPWLARYLGLTSEFWSDLVAGWARGGELAALERLLEKDSQVTLRY